MTNHVSSIVVGVVPGQSAAVLNCAALFARRFDAELVCASVDLSHYTADRRPDGTVYALPINSDLVDGKIEQFDPALRHTIAGVLDPLGVRWSTRALAGGAAMELARLAGDLNAAMIVVGTRERGIKDSLREFLNGSVAAHLTHHQHRPVVVVPVNPVARDDDLPWHFLPHEQ